MVFEGLSLGEPLGGSSSAAGHAVPTPSASDTGARVLFDVGHPAQVHLFRNAMAELDAAGHNTFVTSRVKEVTTHLLDAYDIPHLPLTSRGASLPSLVLELLLREKRLFSVARRFEPDVIVSRLSPAAAHVSTLVGCRNLVVSDTHVESPLMRLLNHRMTLPFVDIVLAPDSLALPVASRKRTHLQFQELAYLHPNYFRPDPDALAAYGVDVAEPYSFVRLAGWDAYHDVGHKGLSPEGIRELIALLSEHGTVYISSEGSLPPELSEYEPPTPPELVHDLLYHAELYVGDSATMSAEAAILGTPAIRTSSMVDTADEQSFVELEHTYGLLSSFSDEDRAIDAVRDLLTGGIDKSEWADRRNHLIEEQPDVTELLVERILDTATSYE